MREYYVQLHKCLVANSAKTALQKIKPVVAELKRIAQWEKEGKIRGEDVDSRGFQYIKVLDDSVEPKLNAMDLVICFETDEIVYPEDQAFYAKVEAERERKERKTALKQQGRIQLSPLFT